MFTRMKCPRYTATVLFLVACLTLVYAWESLELIHPKSLKLLEPVLDDFTDHIITKTAENGDYEQDGNNTIPDFELILLNKKKEEKFRKLHGERQEALVYDDQKRLGSIARNMAEYLISWALKKMKIQQLYSGAYKAQSQEYGNLLEKKVEIHNKKRFMKLEAIGAAKLMAADDPRVLGEIGKIESEYMKKFDKKINKINNNYQEVLKRLPIQPNEEGKINLKDYELLYLKDKNQEKLQNLQNQQQVAAIYKDSKRIGQLARKHASKLVSWEKDNLKIERRYGNGSTVTLPSWKSVLERKLDEHEQKKKLTLGAIDIAINRAQDDPKTLSELHKQKADYLEKCNKKAVKIHKYYGEL